MLRWLQCKKVQAILLQRDFDAEVAADGPLQPFGVARGPREVSGHVQLGMVCHGVALARAGLPHTYDAR
ncbi:hypothetical protein D3C86_1828100 [compost metagenome]